MPDDTAPQAATPNQPEYSVGELSRALKRTLEESYAWVRVRGELSGVKRHSSGHLYFALKDEEAVLDGVCWRGVAARLALRPEDGMEVICTGRITTYPGRSKYQIVVESIALAGRGALLKLLEERKAKLAAEGLFEPGRKQPLPYLPGVIGVVTSPTGAVIRDILHRLQERFPRRVLLWPVAVQGDGAAAQVAAAIAGFDALAPGGPVPRPDLLIVARGGGSIEDLWAFNEEVVVRAAAACRIPLISAIGHETDVTLIDFAADRRAPTPTAAAEMAVPVRAELIARITESGGRLAGGIVRLLDQRGLRLSHAARGLPEPGRLLDLATQRLDIAGERLQAAAALGLERRGQRLAAVFALLPHPAQRVAMAAAALAACGRALNAAGRSALDHHRHRLDRLAPRLAPQPLAARAAEGRRALDRLESRLHGAGARCLAEARAGFVQLTRLLDSASYQRVLERGFALVREPGGEPVTRAAMVVPGQALVLQFADDVVQASAAGAGGAPPPEGARPDRVSPGGANSGDEAPARAASRRRRAGGAPARPPGAGDQGRLL